MASLPALLLAFEHLSTDAPKRGLAEVDQVDGGDFAPKDVQDSFQLNLDPSLKRDPFVKMGLLLMNPEAPKGRNNDSQTAPIVPLATYRLSRATQMKGVNFIQYTSGGQNFRATVLFISPGDTKYKEQDDYGPFIRALRDNRRDSANITYAWPTKPDAFKDQVYYLKSVEHFKSLTRAANQWRDSDGSRQFQSFCNVYVFVKVTPNEPRFLCLGRFEVVNSGANSTTLQLYDPGAIPLAQARVPTESPTYVDDDMRSVTRSLSSGREEIGTSDLGSM